MTVLRALKARGLATDVEVAQAGGPSTSTMTKLRERSLAPTGPRGDVHRKIDTATRWPAGSSRMLWETGRLPDPDHAGTFVAAPGWTVKPEVSNAEILRQVRDMADAIREIVEGNQRIVERLERLDRGEERPAG